MSTKRKQIHGRNPSRAGRDSTETPVRVGGRIKKAKTIYDPSEHLFPRKRRQQEKLLLHIGEEKRQQSTDDEEDDNKQMSSNGSGYQGWCLICTKDTVRKEDPLISCKRCKRFKAHFECLDKKPGEKLEHFENDWQCSQCRMLCKVCEKAGDNGQLTQCWKCFLYYHSSCHQPKIPSKMIGSKKKWICINCDEGGSEEDSRKSREEVAESRESTPSQQVTSSTSQSKKTLGRKKESVEEEEKSVLDEKERKILNPFGDELVPDASTWTAAEVYNHFSKHFPNEADVFREQEIDGASLVLMKRDDVVSGLKLKLGPAIRIYKHVLMLQKRSSDPRLSWL